MGLRRLCSQRDRAQQHIHSGLHTLGSSLLPTGKQLGQTFGDDERLEAVPSDGWPGNFPRTRAEQGKVGTAGSTRCVSDSTHVRTLSCTPDGADLVQSIALPLAELLGMICLTCGLGHATLSPAVFNTEIV